eukprot:5125-Heterococcus_DN1.PRE.2
MTTMYDCDIAVSSTATEKTQSSVQARKTVDNHVCICAMPRPHVRSACLRRFLYCTEVATALRTAKVLPVVAATLNVTPVCVLHCCRWC